MTAFDRNGVDVPVAIAVGGKGNPLSVGAPDGVVIHFDIACEGDGAAAFTGDNPDIAPIGESEILAIGTQGKGAGSGKCVGLCRRQLTRHEAGNDDEGDDAHSFSL